MAGLESQKKAQIAIIKGEVYVEWRPQHFRDASAIGRSSRIAVGVEWR